jgi:HEAT repeat protein
MIRFACPHCQTGLRARDEKAGRSARCPKCRAPITVPAGQSESAPTTGASTPISDSNDIESSWERRLAKQKTGILMLGLFLSGLVCGTVLFVVFFHKIKEARLSRPVHAGQGQVRPAVGKSPHRELPPPHRFVPQTAEEDEKFAGRADAVQASPAGTPVREGREAKEEEYDAPPPKAFASPAPPREGATATAARDDSAERESEALVAPFVKDFRHQKLHTRLQAIEAVARLGPQGRAASRALCDALLDLNPRIRLAAALALDKVNPTLHRLVIPILVDKELDTRLECLRKVGRLGPAGSAAVPVVVYFKQQYLGGAVAVDVLAAIAPDDPSVTAKMAAWLTSDPDPYVRLLAVKALPHMADAKSQVRALVQSLRTDPVDAVRATAASALGDLGADARDADRGLRMAKADASAQVREAAERALEKIQKPASGEASASSLPTTL